MSRPKETTKKETTKKSPRSPSREQRGPNKNEHDRSTPGRRNPEYEKLHSRAVNEDEQLKIVNNREDNAQSSSNNNRKTETDATNSSIPEGVQDENDRVEAGDDQSEVNNRSPKVN
jgi:hypothetical protein